MKDKKPSTGVPVSAAWIKNLCTGAAFYGTGGGGSATKAESILTGLAQRNEIPRIVELHELKPEDLCVSAFGVGSTEADSDARGAVTLATNAIQDVLKQEIKAVIPVEAGPLSIAAAFFAAAALGIPVVNADIVGGRSSPEVFLELITMHDIPRVPAAIANDSGDVAILQSSAGWASEEVFFRNFATMSKGEAFVAGYPIDAGTLGKAVSQGSLSRCCEAGELLLSGKLSELLGRIRGRVLFEGVVISIDKADVEGFFSVRINLSNDSGVPAGLFAKNEYLILWRDGEMICSCPDLLCVVDPSGMPVPSSGISVGMKVTVIGVPCIDQWRTQRGQELFSPRTFGYEHDPVLLDC